MKKSLISVVAMLSMNTYSPSVFALQNTIYCKNSGEVINALTSPRKWACEEGLILASNSCFYGNAAEVVALINKNKFKWEDSAITRGQVLNADSISYVSVSYNARQPQHLKRCTPWFFQKRN